MTISDNKSLIASSLEQDHQEPHESLEDVFQLSKDSIIQLVETFRQHLGTERHNDFVGAINRSRPGLIWNDNVVIARVMAKALNGTERDDRLYADRLYDARLTLSRTTILNCRELQDTSNGDKPLLETQLDSMDTLFALNNLYDDDESFEQYFVGALTAAQYIADSLPASSATTRDAESLLVEFDKRNKDSLPAKQEHYSGLSLLFERISENLSEKKFEDAINYVEYVIGGLEDDAEAIAKRYVSENMIDRVRNYIVGYIQMPEFRKEKIESFEVIMSVLNSMSKSQTQIEDVEIINLEEFKPMEVEWEILPEGQLLDHAKEIVGELEKNSSDTYTPTIDIARLRTLEKVRKEWGADNAYFMKGSLGGRNRVAGEAKECPDQYIMLILQENDADGNLIEHAVAESPIAGPHAMYVYRQDVNPKLTWREVMSKSKADARKMGARPIKHTTNVEADQLIEVMSDRVSTLLTATPEEFLRLEFNGKRVKLKQSLAIKAFIAIDLRQ